MYRRLESSHFTDGHITANLVKTLQDGDEIGSSLLFNTFENVAFADFTMNRVYVEHLIKLGAPHVHLAGSGPALYTMFREKEQAAELCTRCKDQGMEVYLAGAV